MPRYFLEVAYKGSAYSGFQKQANANTVQAEIERAFSVLQKNNVELTGSSRTDAGVHARQNFFHFDYHETIPSQFLYKLNAILPLDIVAVNMEVVPDDAHCRFDASSRAYRYFIHQTKNPFLQDQSYYYPYTLDFEKLNEAAKLIMQFDDFASFSKRNTQVKSFICRIDESEWTTEGKLWLYHVKANRFLRGMVRGLTGTMLQVARGKISIENLQTIIEARDNTKAYFAVPAKGLFLEKVEFPEAIYKGVE